MQILLLSFFVPLVLCFGSVSVHSEGETTTRKTIFEANKNVQLYKGSNPNSSQFVVSYVYPTLSKFNGFLIAVAEARYGSYEDNFAGEVVATYSADQGATWKTIVAIPRKTTNPHSRSINPTVFHDNNKFILFAERFKEKTHEWRNYKSGGGDFVYSSLNVVTTEKKTDAKKSLTFSEPVSLLTESFLNGMEHLKRTRLLGGFGRGIEVNKTAIVPVWFFVDKKEGFATVLRSDSSNWRFANGSGGSGTLESAVVEWEGKLIMNARINCGYRKVYESTDMGDTWNEALGSLSRVWGNSPNRHGYGSSASFITVTIENTPVMLFSNPLSTKNMVNRYELHLWVTDNKRIYDVGKISGNNRNTGHSSLLYTNGSLYCLYEDAAKLTRNFSSVLAHLVNELKKIKDIIKQWKNQDNAFSESCDGKDSTPSYPGSTCEVHIPQNGLVGFLSNEVILNKWKDAYSCVDAEITHGEKVKNGIKFNAKGAGAMWPVGKQGQNQRYHFMNHEFTLAATIIIHECNDPSSTPLLSVVLDTTGKTLMEIECTNEGKLSFLEGAEKNKQLSFSTDTPIRVVFTLQKGSTKLYIDGNLINEKKHTFTSGLLSTPISHICILQCERSSTKQDTYVTVKNVLLYNRVLEAKEIRLLYLSAVPTRTPTISNTISQTKSLSKTLSTTKTSSHSLSHTTTQSLSQSTSQSQSLSHTGTQSQSLSHTLSDSQSLSHTRTVSQSLSRTADKVCPLIFVEMFPAGDLTQKDIDGSNKGKRILLVSLPKQFNWSNNDFIGSLISFSGGEGTNQTNGFSGEWGKILQSAMWRRNTTNPRSVLEVEIPTYSNYDIEYNEQIVISADAKAVNSYCRGSINGSFIIRAENVSKVVKDSKAFDSDISSMATVTVFFAGGAGSILEIQALSLLSRMNCAPKEERHWFNLLPYLTSIFVNFGSLWIVLGNALIVLIFGFIHYCVTVVYKHIRGGDSSKAWSRMFFPNFTYFVAYIMHIGIFVHSVSLLFMLKAEWNYYFVGITGTSYGLIFPFFVIYYVTRYTDVQFVTYPHFINQSCFKRWMSPHGYWNPLNQVKMYGSMFFTMKGGYLYWCMFRLSIVSIAGIVTVIPTSSEKCHMQYFFLMGIFLFGSIVTAVANMMRSLFLTSMHTLSFFLLASLCFISGLNYILPNKTFLNAYFLFKVMLLIVVFITMLYKACLLFYDWMNVTDDAMNSITMKEPFTEGKFEKNDTKRDTVPYGKEDPCVLMQGVNLIGIRNEPYNN